MSGHSEPVLVQARPLLEWLDDAFSAWGWRIDAGRLAPPVPARIVTATGLRRWLLAETTDYPTRDRVWAQVVIGSRSGPDARAYRFLALGLALAGLRNYRRRIHVRSAADLPDVHSDIAAGFLTRLATIDPAARNLAGRLIDSGIGYAARRYRDQQSRPLPVHIASLGLTPADGGLARAPRRIGRGASTVRANDDVETADAEALLQELAARSDRNGVRIRCQDLELIAATRLDGRSLTQAATELGIPAEAAYKRRRRAEQRLATVLQPVPTGPHDPVSERAARPMSGPGGG
jgi:hypothetical protein